MNNLGKRLCFFTRILLDLQLKPAISDGVLPWNFNSLRYCQRRLLCTRKTSIKNCRFLHKSQVINKSVSPEKEDSSSEKSLTKSQDPGQQEVPLVDYADKKSSSVNIIERVRPPAPVVEDRETSLPHHDVGRITPESRKLELKASSIFTRLAEERGASKETFVTAVNMYIDKETLYRRGATEFIYAGMQEMKRYGLLKDLGAYKALLQAFPEGKMIPRNAWQVEFMHYPRQQQCGIDLMEQMEHNGVVPDDEFGKLLKNRFGSEAHVTRKYRRMMYWLPKFKNMNPYPIPLDLPEDAIQLALIALKRMCVDRETKYQVFQTSEIEGSQEDTFIASAQSPIQQELVSKHKIEQPLFVEGPYPVYLRDRQQRYFLLRAEPNINALMKQKQLEKEEKSDENLFEWTNFFEEEECKEIRPILSIHEQEDSTILALCITGTSSKASVVTWIRCLETSNPNLSRTPVLFKLSSLDSQLDVIGDNRPLHEIVR